MNVKLIAQSVFFAGLFLFLVSSIPLILYGGNKKEPLKILKEIRTLTTSTVFMVAGIGVQLFFT